jgi:hypothetical protein
VVKELFDKLRKLPGKGRESFLVIEDFGYGFAVTRAKIKNKNKKIEISESGFVENFEEIKKPVFPVDKAILAVDSKKAVTIESVIRLRRSEPDQPVSETELDTLVFRGLWEFLNRYRSTASKKLGAHDLDLVLAGAEIREVLLGSYKVFNPLGFKGANLHFRYRGTFIRRELKSLVEKMDSWGRDKILIESGGVLSLSIPWPFDYFIFVGDKYADVFMGSEEEQLHLKTLSWGSGRIVKKIALLFGVSTDVALEILLSFDENPPAKKIKAVIEKTIEGEIQSFLKLIPKSRAPRQRPSFYLSFNLPLRCFEKFFGPRIKFVDFESWLTKQGYGVIINQESPVFFNRNNTLALITHVYSPPQYQFLNELLARRARWLTAKT